MSGYQNGRNFAWVGKGAPLTTFPHEVIPIYSDTVQAHLVTMTLLAFTRIMVYNGHLKTGTLGSLDFFEIFNGQV